MKKYKLLFRTLSLVLLTNLHSHCFSQISKENLFKKYIFNDSIAKNDALLFLYNDGTFINFGLVSNEKEKEWYIWLTSGSYKVLPKKIVLQSTLGIDKMNGLLQNIKNHYKYRKDHVLIANDYETQLETFKDYILIINNEKLTDSSKKIEYKEAK